MVKPDVTAEEMGFLKGPTLKEKTSFSPIQDGKGVVIVRVYVAVLKKQVKAVCMF